MLGFSIETMKAHCGEVKGELFFSFANRSGQNEQCQNAQKCIQFEKAEHRLCSPKFDKTQH